MAKVVIATGQTPWECRWTVPHIPPTATEGAPAADAIWACVRSGKPRPVGDADCEHCPHWEMDDRRVN